MTNYFIFSRNLSTGITIAICNGCRADKDSAAAHWVAYMYGFMDAEREFTGKSDMKEGSTEKSFIIRKNGIEIEYFMLLDDEGRDLLYKISGLNK